MDIRRASAQEKRAHCGSPPFLPRGHIAWMSHMPHRVSQDTSGYTSTAKAAGCLCIRVYCALYEQRVRDGGMDMKGRRETVAMRSGCQ